VEKLSSKPREARFVKDVMSKQIITARYKIQLFKKFFKVYWNWSVTVAVSKEIHRTLL
jgi:hypothetical protein